MTAIDALHRQVSATDLAAGEARTITIRQTP